MAGAEIVDRGFKAQRVVVVDDPVQVATVVYTLALGKLEHNTF